MLVLQKTEVVTRIQKALAGAKPPSVLSNGFFADHDLQAVSIDLDHGITVGESRRYRVEVALEADFGELVDARTAYHASSWQHPRKRTEGRPLASEAFADGIAV